MTYFCALNKQVHMSVLKFISTMLNAVMASYLSLSMELYNVYFLLLLKLQLSHYAPRRRLGGEEL
jgi:hypothetical protein